MAQVGCDRVRTLTPAVSLAVSTLGLARARRLGAAQDGNVLKREAKTGKLLIT